MTDRQCAVCRGRLEPERLASVTGTASGLRAVLEPVWVLGCPDRHERRYLEADYSSRLSDAVTEAFPAARRKAIFGSGIGRCSKCRTPLTEPPETRTEKRRLPLLLLTTPLTEEPVTLEITGEFLTCANCSAVQLTPSAHDDLRLALSDGFELEAIRP